MSYNQSIAIRKNQIKKMFSDEGYETQGAVKFKIVNGTVMYDQTLIAQVNFEHTTFELFKVESAYLKQLQTMLKNEAVANGFTEELNNV